MRRGEDIYKEQNLSAPDLSRQDLLGAMEKYPVLIERPIVVTEKGTRICRPPECVREIL